MVHLVSFACLCVVALLFEVMRCVEALGALVFVFDKILDYHR